MVKISIFCVSLPFFGGGGGGELLYDQLLTACRSTQKSFLNVLPVYRSAFFNFCPENLFLSGDP